jgi:outer membrane lipoprotein-sorting protein
VRVLFLGDPIMQPVWIVLAAAVVAPVTAGEPGQRLKPLGTLEGAHPQVLNSNVAFSPGGKRLASPTGGIVKLWDVDKRQVVAMLQHPFGAEGPDRKRGAAVAFSPDGKLLASTVYDRTVQLWDVATGKAKISFTGGGPVAFSPDGKTLAAGLKLWDLSKGKARPPLEGLDTDERGIVNAVVFSPDGKTLAVGGGKVSNIGLPGLGWVKLWEVATGRLRFSVKGQEFSDQDPEGGGPEMVHSVAFSPDGKTLASASVYGSVLLWDLRSGKRTATLQAFDPDSKAEENVNPAFSVAFSPDGSTLAVGTLRGLKFWDVKSGRPSALQGPPATVWSVAFRRDGKTVATAEAKRKPGRSEFGDFSEPTIRLWKLPASLPLVQENEAEKLFRAMEEKIHRARAFRVAVDIKITAERQKGKDQGGQLKGSLILTQDNKARLTLRGKVAGEAMNREMVSDGKHITCKDYLPEPPERATQTAPKKLHAMLSMLLTRAGVYGTSESIVVANGFGEQIPASVQRIDAWDFKGGAAAKVGGREARVVRYKVGRKGEGVAQATVWIDAKTLLPLRYVIGDGTGRLTEIYHELTLDPKVDAKVFALPK